jgi:hypothetical protein
MALVHHHFEVTVSFMESSGKTVDRTYVALPASVADYDQLVTVFAASLPAINAATDSVISSYSYKDVWIDNAIVLPVDAENSDQAFGSAKISGDPTDSGTFSIPAAAIGNFVAATGKGRDIANTAAASIFFNYANLFGGATGDWTISDGERLDMGTLGGKRRNVASSGT